MPLFDHDYAEEIIQRLAKDNGKFSENKSCLIQHLYSTLQYSRGIGSMYPDSSTWFSRVILKPLVLHGFFPVIEVSPRSGPQDNRVAQEAGVTLKDLSDELDTYLALVQAGELSPVAHPKLGPFDIDDWASWHIRHFEYHLKDCP